MGVFILSDSGGLRAMQNLAIDTKSLPALLEVTGSIECSFSASYPCSAFIQSSYGCAKARQSALPRARKRASCV